MTRCECLILLVSRSPDTQSVTHCCSLIIISSNINCHSLTHSLLRTPLLTHSLTHTLSLSVCTSQQPH